MQHEKITQKTKYRVATTINCCWGQHRLSTIGTNSCCEFMSEYTKIWQKNWTMYTS